MPATISASVGFHGTNRSADVKTVQRLLNQVPATKGGPDAPLVEDGVCGKITIAAIRRFQQASHGTAEALVDSGGRLLQALIAWSTPVPGLNSTSQSKAVPLAAINVAPADATNVHKRNYATAIGGKSPDALSVSDDKLRWLLDALQAAEDAIRGTPETQGGGYFWYGKEPNNKKSTASKAAKGADVQQIDVLSILEVFGMLAKVLPNGSAAAKGKDMFGNWDKFWKEAAKDPGKRAQIIEKLRKIREDLEKEFGNAGIDTARIRPAGSSASVSDTNATTIPDAAPGVPPKRATLYGNESSRQSLWIWQWDFGGGNKGPIGVYRWDPDKVAYGLKGDWVYIDGADELEHLDWKYRCLCRPVTINELKLPGFLHVQSLCD